MPKRNYPPYDSPEAVFELLERWESYWHHKYNNATHRSPQGRYYKAYQRLQEVLVILKKGQEPPNV